MNKPNKTHTSTGVELSNLFVGEDGLLTLWSSEHEAEIVGAITTPFGDGWIGKIK